MSRVIFWLLLLFVAQWFWRRAVRRHLAQHGARVATAARRARTGPVNVPSLPEPMVRCAECDAYAPVSESVGVGARHFCCAAHAQRFARRAGGAGKGREAR